MGKLLIVDDIEQNREILRRRLARKGYDILEAEGGPAALILIEVEEIDLVLLDIRMPGMDGNQVLAKIRETYSPTDLPVIMVTAETDSSSMIKSLGLGADDYVTKPIDFPVLVARIENKLALKRMVAEQLAEKGNEEEPELDAASVQALIDGGETQTVEFKSSLRWNLHSGKVGKEIEIAWLKTVVAFLNSDGGHLLVGVADDGEILGTSIDKFQNEDKYLLHVNNLLKSAIGMEYISYIAFDLYPVGDEKVLVITSKPHPEAVFLVNGNDEEFYVRFGPSSRKLSTKEVLSYMQSRG